MVVLHRICKLGGINVSRIAKSEVRILFRKTILPDLRALSSRATSAEFRSDVVNDNNTKLPERLVSCAPAKWQPYLKLARYDKPIGTWLLYWPCTWGIASAASAGCLPDPYMLALFGTGALVMRGAGCTINDMWDRDIDGKVARTFRRPLVNGDLTMKQAWIFLAGQLSVGLGILLQLNWYSVFLGASSLGLVVAYPLMKRVTHWPQLTLGFAFNWGALLGYSAVRGYLDLYTCVPLYVAGICWTIVYDTIYAHQDIKDDLKLGMKSTAIHFGDKTKLWLSGFSSVMVSNLALSGLMNDQTWPYYTSLCILSLHLANQIATLNIENPTDCAKKFTSNFYAGFVLFCGILLGNLFKNTNHGTFAVQETVATKHVM